MRRFTILAVALLAVGCSSHSSMPTPSNITPQIFQRHVTKNGWVLTPIKPAGMLPFGMVSDSADHKIWVAAQGGGKGELVEILMNGFQKSHPLSISPGELALGSDGNLWATAYSGYILRVTPAGVETDFKLPDPTMLPGNIISGPDGALWFTQCTHDETAGGIGRMDTQGNYTFSQSTCQTIIQNGSDGRIWFGDTGANLYAMTTQGQTATWPVGDKRGFFGSAVGSDGVLYATADTTIGNTEIVSVTTKGVVTHLGQDPWIDGMRSMGAGPDGKLWISDGRTNAHLVFFDPATQTFTGRIASPHGYEGNIAAGSDGNVWVDDEDTGSVNAYIIQAMSVVPSKFTATLGNPFPITVTENNYSGQWTAVSSDLNVATVTLDSQNGQFTVTPVGVGTCSIVIYDTMFNSIKVKVTVQ